MLLGAATSRRILIGPCRCPRLPPTLPERHRPVKIARIESFILGTNSSKDLLFCRVETEDGTYGWGEGYVTAGKETVIAECIKAIAPHVIGRSVSTSAIPARSCSRISRSAAARWNCCRRG